MVKKLIIPGQLPNLNDYTKACRTNRFAGAKMKKDAEKIVSAYISQQLKGVQFTGKVRISFSWYEPNRRRDIDNVAFAKKFVLDALVSAGVLTSDGWNGVAGFTDVFMVDRHNPRIEVEIESVGDKDGQIFSYDRGEGI